MSPKKILFFIITGAILLSLIIGILYISNKKKAPTTNTKSIKIWITDGTTESYKPLIDGFKAYAPEYAKTEIIIEKQTSDSDRYRTLLLSTLTEGNGPDIFMLHSGEDAILETKIEPIPSTLINISEFDKTYDDLFQGLIYASGSGKEKITGLKGVPLGYETLWVFYNKGLLRSVPTNWDEFDTLYRSFPDGKYPSNIGLGPTYVPNMTDILPIWLTMDDVYSYNELSSSKTSISKYLNYGTISISESSNQDSGTDGNMSISSNSLHLRKPDLIEKKLTTLDLFMQGDIGMIIGYPSLILDLEKAQKRNSSEDSSVVVLTERIPQSSTKIKTNIGRYSYFGISKLTNNGAASLKFLEYLMTPEAQRLYMNEYPYMIPAQSEFYETASIAPLSETLPRTKLAPFIPQRGEKISVFDYGLKSRFEYYLKEGIDSTETPNTERLTSKISKDIYCDIQLSGNGEKTDSCQNE